uniref:Uncharacterized protein n=1 Tax=Rhizophora mucronata TaxID=61149 RepID=A0A2P2IJ28_RHIMU
MSGLKCKQWLTNNSQLQHIRIKKEKM